MTRVGGIDVRLTGDGGGGNAHEQHPDDRQQQGGQKKGQPEPVVDNLEVRPGTKRRETGPVHAGAEPEVDLGKQRASIVNQLEEARAAFRYMGTSHSQYGTLKAKIERLEMVLKGLDASGQV